MDQDVLRNLIAAEIKRATAPLEAEIQWLKAEVQALKAGNGTVASSLVVSPVISSEPAPVWNPEPVAQTAISEEPIGSLPANVPPDRSDFARFLARGLEQEAKEYAEERPEPEKKKGWNPFKK